MTRAIFFTSVMLLAAAAVPTAAYAQACGKWDYTVCTEDDHAVPHLSTDIVANSHNDCRYCAIGDCGHHPCGLNEEQEVEIVQALFAAVERGDIESAASLFIESEWSHLNSMRSAIQVISCQGDLVAHLPIPGDVFAALQESVQVLEALH